jgi:glycosyltransferase involved in cell wall biosynthesis
MTELKSGSFSIGTNMQETSMQSQDSPLSICFVAPNAYAALSGREDLTNNGGAERQQVLLANELVRRGHLVSFVVFDHGQPDTETINSIRILKCYSSDNGIPGFRFLHPRLTGLWRALRQADADVYYQRCASASTGLVRHWCCWNHRAFVFAAAHDADCTAGLPLLPRRVDRLLFRYGLRHADRVIAQTTVQQRLLAAEFGVDSVVIPNSFAWAWGSQPVAQSARPASGPDRVLWIGRFNEEKRPEWLLRLARDLPVQRFDVVGRCDSPYGQEIVAQLERLPNVQWHGYVPHRRMLDLYLNARLLLCTSEWEGFPNVFLEAWSCQRGVLSTVDPDGVIAGAGTGVVVTSYAEIAQHLARLGQQRAFWEETGLRGRRYMERHHDVRAAGETLLHVVTGTRLRSRSAPRQ